MAMDIAYKNAAGTPVGALGNDRGAGLVSDYFPGLYEIANRGNVYSAVGLTNGALGGSLTATGVTWHLSNPAGSGVNLVILAGGVCLATATTAGHIVWCFNGTGGVSTAVVHGTPGVINNMKLGTSGVAGKAQFDTSATLPATPIALRGLGFVQVTALSVSGQIIDYVNGSIIVVPGTTLSIQSVTGVGTGMCWGTWAEVAI